MFTPFRSSFSTFIFLIIFTQISYSATLDDCVITWQTDNYGSSSASSITIPIVGGPYDVDWDNDGIFDESGLSDEITHDFLVAGTYTIRINFTNANSFQFFFDNSGDYAKITSIDQWGTGKFSSMEKAFYGTKNLQINASDTPDLSTCISMNFVFRNSNVGTGSGNWNWDTSNITEMKWAFAFTNNFNKNIDTWNVSKVTDMTNMFRASKAFNQDLKNWNVSNVTTMLTMFGESQVFNGDISTWDVSNVENMSYMFADALEFNRDISNWNTASLINMEAMFRGAANFNGDLLWDVSKVTNLDTLFSGATNFNGDISSWNVGNVTSMRETFRDTEFFNCDISSWNVSNVEGFHATFLNAQAFNQNIESWNTSKCTSMTYMFFKAKSFDQNLSSWNMEKITDLREMFGSTALSVQNYNALLIGWESQNLQDNLNFSAGESKYTENSAASLARSNIITNHNWTITDGGHVPSYSIGGTITGDTLENITVSAGTQSTLTDVNGNYTITGLSDGLYTITPTLMGVSFNPSKRDVTINGSDLTQIDFISSGTPIGEKHTLTVNNGTNSGEYEENEIVNVSATVPQSMVFKEWTGDIQFLEDAKKENASVTMPGQDITITATFDDAPPVALGDLYTTELNTAINIASPGILSNDTAPNLNPLTASLETDVKNGTLIFNNDGSFTYTPNNKFFGSDFFTYKAYNGKSYSNICTVTINVSIQKVTIGINVSVSPSQIQGLHSNDTFDKTPKIYGVIDGKNLTLKKDKSSTENKAIGMWKKPYALNEKIKEHFASKINGTIQEKIVLLKVKGKVNGTKIDNNAQSVLLVPPEITSCTLNGDTLVIVGKFFGSKAPKLTLEPIGGGKLIKCKVDKKAYIFDPSSPTNTLIGTIKMNKIQRGTTYSVILSNKIGIGVIKNGNTNNLLPEISL